MSLRFRKIKYVLLLVLVSLFVLFAGGSSMSVDLLRSGSGDVSLSISKEKLETEIADLAAWGAIKSDGHKYGEEWKSDANNHYKECACGEKSENAPHIDGNGDYKCDTCEYAMPAQAPNNPNQPDNPDQSDNPDDPGTTPPEDNPDDPGTTPPADNHLSDDEGGLGAGAIVGIVIGSVAVVGVGGFALFWFVIKKKSFADLIAVFKK